MLEIGGQRIIMNKKITYFMEKDTRLITDNLEKVIIDEDTVVIKYTAFRKNLNDITITAIRYYKSKKTMIIYGKLKKYNSNVYEAFIKWGEDNGIKLYSIGEEEL